MEYSKKFMFIDSTDDCYPYHVSELVRVRLILQAHKKAPNLNNSGLFYELVA